MSLTREPTDRQLQLHVQAVEIDSPRATYEPNCPWCVLARRRGITAARPEFPNTESRIPSSKES